MKDRKEKKKKKRVRFRIYVYPLDIIIGEIFKKKKSMVNLVGKKFKLFNFTVWSTFNLFLI